MPLLKYAKKTQKLLELIILRSKINPSIFDNRPPTLVGPNRDYKKFILIGHQRSGSTLIIGSLKKHPQAVTFGELLVEDQIGFNIKGYDNSCETLYQARKAFPIEFLNRYIFSSYPKETKTVGFKLFPDHLDNQHFKGVWDWVKQNQDVAIIFLSRRNKLASYASLLVAKKTKVFNISKDSQRTTTTVTMDKEECLAEFKKREQYEAVVREHIANHKVMDITYEDLSEDPYAIVTQVQEFLGLDYSEPIITLKKKEIRPLSEVIDNYHELKQQFADTPWSSYFEEERN